MKSGKIWSTVVDYFLILSAIIGVGFASGKEIYVFFFSFGKNSFIGLISFALLFIYLFFVIDYVKFKLSINSYNQFNTIIFSKLTKFTNIILIINFIITSAGMLAGADYLFSRFFNINYRLVSIAICLITFFIVIGGIDRIRGLSNFVIPLMIAVIVINSLVNVKASNVHFDIVKGNGMMAVYYGLLFGVNNFVAALPIMFETRLKAKGKVFTVITICVIILLNILVLASNNFYTDMPMFELSKNLNSSFYYIYFSTLVLALFCTFVICNYNVNKILSNNKNKKFMALITIIVCFIISNLNYNFIVKYLYVVSGVFSAIYIISLILLMCVRLIKAKQK